jgi:hypothetical protein
MSQGNMTEMRSYLPDNSHDVSATSRVLLSKREEETRMKRDRYKIQREYNKLKQVINLPKMMLFIYECLAADVFYILFYAFNLLQALDNIEDVISSSLYIIKYLLAIFNAVLYLNIIIEYRDFKKQNALKTTNQDPHDLEEKARLVSAIGWGDSKKQKKDLKYVHINRPLQGVKKVITFRFFSWHIKYFIYIIIVCISENLNVSEYFNILFMLFDYFLYHLMIFYFKVMLRIEFMKQKYDLTDDHPTVKQ